MKHTLKITLFLLLIFLASQLTGIAIISKYTKVESGKIGFNALPLGFERPEVNADYSFIYLIIGVLIGTVIFLFLVRYRQIHFWKVWFFFAVSLSLIIAFYAFYNNEYIIITLAIALAAWKIFRPNLYIHNLTEVFIYGGIAAIFVPVMSIFAGVMMLLVISIYDMYAVWKSKHMMDMANFQNESHVFAGISIPYSLPKEKKDTKKIMALHPSKQVCTVEVKTAILGGGDIAFPLIFSGIVFNSLIIGGTAMQFAMLQILIITAACTFSLGALFYFAKKDRFYPAMPFISIGCFVGYLIVYLINI